VNPGDAFHDNKGSRLIKHANRLLTLAFAGLLPAATNVSQTLGEFPLCEGSSAVIVPCHGFQGYCLLVGDNEQREELFSFPIVNGAVSLTQQERIPLRINKEVSDIEALVTLQDNSVLVMGSHSRNTKCESKKSRRRFAQITLPRDDAVHTPVVESKKIKCSHLFEDLPPGDAALQAVCAAIDGAEKQAGEVEKRLEQGEVNAEAAKAECGQVLPFNAEGAAAIDEGNATRIWVGLRAPLVGGLPGDSEHRDLAILLRMKGIDNWTFDRVALLDLDGRGIRELAADAAHVWVIAGPAGDHEVPFQLRRFAAAALDNAQVITSELIEVLPSSSEGLAIAGDQAYVIIDGEVGEAACIKPSSLLEMDLP
jgi:hypothetical protein